jgi:ElaB/YqjD/DUF883 family membrane-anchored ribosome-binding protein
MSQTDGAALRLRLASLYLRVAETLEESADLADRHAQRCRGDGRAQLMEVEMENARKARAAAQRSRAVAWHLKIPR